MAINEETQQVEIADQLAEIVKTLAHSTRAVPKPSDSYALIADLAQAQEILAQIYAQLADWHGRVVDGTHYNGEDGRGTASQPAAEQVKGLLELAAHEADQAADQLRKAHSANGVIRWFDDIPETDQT